MQKWQVLIYLNQLNEKELSTILLIGDFGGLCKYAIYQKPHIVLITMIAFRIQNASDPFYL